MNELGIEYWDYDDGSVGAKFVEADGDIWAGDEQILFSSMLALCIAVQEAQQEVNAEGKPRVVNLGMQGKWTDGVYAVRWLTLPRFGVSFTSQEKLQKWLEQLVKVAATSQPPHKIKTHD